MSIYTLLKVATHYDLSVLFKPVMSLKKKKQGEGGWGELYAVFILFLESV